MINIVDARMGMGKSSAAFQHMNEHPDRKYLYVTEFEEETRRPQDECPGLDFVTPERIPWFNNRKSDHLVELVGEGRNISMTHALYARINKTTIDALIAKDYVVIIDEVMDVLEKTGFRFDTVDAAVKLGVLVRNEDGDGTVRYTLGEDRNYGIPKLSDLINLAKTGRLEDFYDDGQRTYCFFWTLHPELLAELSEIYVLTYLFDGLPMRAFLDMNHIPYQYIGVKRVGDREDGRGVYRFVPREDMDESEWDIASLLHVLDDEKLNRVGDKPTALSVNWYKSPHRAEDGLLDKLRRNLNTYFATRCPDSSTAKDMLWCTFEAFRENISGRNNKNGYLAWNTRATNKYRDRTCVAYLVNVFLDPCVISYLGRHGTGIDPDRYALAYMVQFLWRGAIRDGREMWVYVPSSRMRKLLLDWIASFHGGDID